MDDRFSDSWAAIFHQFAEQNLRSAYVGEKEEQVLRLFYDEKLKAHRETVPRFYIFARLCEGKLENSWDGIMVDAMKALQQLKKADLIEDVTPSLSGSQIAHHVGTSDMYRLTVPGFEKLQEAHPPLALKLRGWIAVMPPWLVLAGSVAGGIAALWKLAELFF